MASRFVRRRRRRRSLECLTAGDAHSRVEVDAFSATRARPDIRDLILRRAAGASRTGCHVAKSSSAIGTGIIFENLRVIRRRSASRFIRRRSLGRRLEYGATRDAITVVEIDVFPAARTFADVGNSILGGAVPTPPARRHIPQGLPAIEAEVVVEDW